jgi:dienelactone hydrolase
MQVKRVVCAQDQGVIVSLDRRSRDHNPQSTVSREHCLAYVEHLCQLPFVGPRRVVAYGCSGGGDPAMEIAAATTHIRAIGAEEPASFIFAGIFNASFPKNGERFTPIDSPPIGEDPKRCYPPKYLQITRAKTAKIQCPVLMLLGDRNWVVPFNKQVLIPELRAAGKTLEVIDHPGEPHCFRFMGHQRPAAARKAFRDMEVFCRCHIATKPRPPDSSVVKVVPL